MSLISKHNEKFRTFMKKTGLNTLEPIKQLHSKLNSQNLLNTVTVRVVQCGSSANEIAYSSCR